MKIKCPYCGVKGEIVDGKCSTCELPISSQKSSNEIASKILDDLEKKESEAEKKWKSDNVIRITYLAKSYSTAVLLWLFLGGFGAHKFYLEKLPQGFGYIVMVAISIAFPRMFIPLIICWIVDIYTMREQVDAFNRQLEKN